MSASFFPLSNPHCLPPCQTRIAPLYSLRSHWWVLLSVLLVPSVLVYLFGSLLKSISLQNSDDASHLSCMGLQALHFFVCTASCHNQAETKRASQKQHSDHPKQWCTNSLRSSALTPSVEGLPLKPSLLCGCTAALISLPERWESSSLQPERLEHSLPCSQ